MEQNEISENVVYKEHISILMGKKLISKGFCLASCTGVAHKSVSSTSEFGILYRDPETKSSRRSLIGILWFRDLVRGATNSNWVFDVHGRKYVELAKRLAIDAVLAFNINNVEIRLIREELEFETYLSDWD